MVSDAVANFLPERRDSAERMIGQQVEEIFAPESQPGAAVLRGLSAADRTWPGRWCCLRTAVRCRSRSDLIREWPWRGRQHGNTADAARYGQRHATRAELEVSRRLAAIGRITAGVGHEVKNPINAMVLHLELLRNKLAHGAEGNVAARSGMWRF